MNKLTINNVSHKKELNLGILQVHVGPFPIPPIKSNNDEKLDKYFVKITFRRDTTSEKSDLYEFKMTLFDNGDPAEFLLFISNFNMTLEVSATLLSCKKNSMPSYPDICRIITSF